MIAPTSTTLFIFLCWPLGFLILILAYKHKGWNKIRINAKRIEDSYEYTDSQYQNLSESELKQVVSSMQIGYPALLALYGILLAFMVSDKISYALSSWHFVLWCGWILAIIVRIGIVLVSLFDVSQSGRLHLARTIYDAKQFFKIVVILIVPTVAFLPMLHFAKSPDSINVNSLQWGVGLSTVSTALAIVFAFLLFFFPAFRPQVFAKKSGLFDVMLMLGLLMSASLFMPVESSPLDPVEFTSFDNHSFNLPSAFNFLGFLGMMFFILVITWRSNMDKVVRRKK